MKFKAIVLLFVLTVFAGQATADPAPACEEGVVCHLRMRNPSTLITYHGDQLALPPGRFLDEPAFDLLDKELKRLQDQETRLQAENDSFRESLKGWTPGWVTLSIAALVGVSSGLGVYYWYDHR